METVVDTDVVASNVITSLPDITWKPEVAPVEFIVCTVEPLDFILTSPVPENVAVKLTAVMSGEGLLNAI